MKTQETSKLEENTSISNESQTIARDKQNSELYKLRKGESIVVKMIGGWDKSVQIPYGGDYLEGYYTVYEYEFEIIEGVGLLEADPTIVRIWRSGELYFKKLNPMIQKGHRKFRITKTCARDRTKWGIVPENIGAKPSYEIEAVDEVNPALAILP